MKYLFIFLLFFVSTSYAADPLLIKEANGYNLYIPTTIDETQDWTGLMLVLERLTDKRITLYMHGYGGDVASTMQLLEALKKYYVKVNIKGLAVSADALLMCRAQELVIDSKTIVMFHGAHDRNNKKTSFNKEIDNRWMIPYAKENCSWLLTAEDLRNILKGKEIYFTGAQVQEAWNKTHGVK